MSDFNSTTKNNSKIDKLIASNFKNDLDRLILETTIIPKVSLEDILVSKKLINK